MCMFIPEWITALSAFALAWITLVLAIYTGKLWRSTERNSQLELRAYISVGEESKGRRIEEGKRAKVQSVITNNGKTPAHAIICNSDIVILPKDIKENSQLPKLKDKELISATMAAGEAVFLATEGDYPVDSHHLADICGFGNNRLYLYGTITYRDAFTENQYTNFCYQIQVSPDGTVTGWHITPCHNDRS